MGYAAAPCVAFIVYGIQTFLLHNNNNNNNNDDDLHLPLCQHALSTRLMCSGRSAFLQDVIVQCSMYIPQS